MQCCAFASADTRHVFVCLGSLETALLFAASGEEGTASGVTPGTDVSQRGGISPAPTDESSTGSSTAATSSPATVAPVPISAPAPAPTLVAVPPEPSAVLEAVPVDPSLGNYDAPMTLPVIPVAVELLPSGKVLSIHLLLSVTTSLCVTTSIMGYL